MSNDSPTPTVDAIDRAAEIRRLVANYGAVCASKSGDGSEFDVLIRQLMHIITPLEHKCASLERTHLTLDNHNAIVADKNRDIARLEAELAGVRADAARYRWLRSEVVATNPFYYGFWQEAVGKLCRVEKLDALIDEWMEKRP